MKSRPTSASAERAINRRLSNSLRVFVPTLALVLALVGSLTIGSSLGLGQETTKAATTKKKERAKPRGRLPAYYSRVVTSEQREQIYGIQAKFAVEMEKLRMQLETLGEQRDAEVRKVLSDEQRAKVASYQAEAKKRRLERSKSKTSRRKTEATESTKR